MLKIAFNKNKQSVFFRYITKEKSNKTANILWRVKNNSYIYTVINIHNMITTDKISVGEYAADLVDPITEAEFANQFTFYPQPPLKVKDLEMDIRDEYNGLVNIIMTNGDRIIIALFSVSNLLLYFSGKFLGIIFYNLKSFLLRLFFVLDLTYVYHHFCQTNTVLLIL